MPSVDVGFLFGGSFTLKVSFQDAVSPERLFLSCEQVFCRQVFLSSEQVDHFRGFIASSKVVVAYRSRIQDQVAVAVAVTFEV